MNAYEQMVKDLSKPGTDILSTLTARDTNLWHLATVLSIRSGNVLDVIKKRVVYRKDVNIYELRDELSRWIEVARQLGNVLVDSDEQSAGDAMGASILKSLTPSDCNLLHMAIGISGESAELLGATASAVIYRNNIDRENVIEERGDLEFYMEGVRQELEITREETLVANQEKLAKRYSDFKYSDKQAHDRADKDDGWIMHDATETSVRPVPDDAILKIRLQSGLEFIARSGDTLYWTPIAYGKNIVAYKVITEKDVADRRIK